MATKEEKQDDWTLTGTEKEEDAWTRMGTRGGNDQPTQPLPFQIATETQLIIIDLLERSREFNSFIYTLYYILNEERNHINLFL